MISIDLGSKYQRFIINILLRMSLSIMLDNSAQFMMIDESFDCLDQQNKNHISDIFGVVCSSFKFIFVVSHLIELQSMLTNPLTIENTMINDTEIASLSMLAIPREKTILQDEYVQCGDDFICECGTKISSRR